MKTINEIMIEVKNISNSINELCSEIDELSNVEKNENQIDMNKLNSLAKRYPIKGHPVAECDIYTRKLYQTLLASITQIENDMNTAESVFLFLSRINEGNESNNLDMEEILKNSIEFNEKIVDEATIVIKKNKLNLNFALDSVIIANLTGRCSDKVMEYLSLLFELLEIPKKQVAEITQLAVLILEQNEVKYKVFCCNELNINLSLFTYYILEFCEGIIANNSKNFHFEYNKIRPMDIKNSIRNIESINSESVIIKNVEISEMKTVPAINKSGNILIDNCLIKDNETSLKFHECENLLIINSTFKNLKDRAIYFGEGTSLTINNTEFESCKHYTDAEYSYGYQESGCGGAIYISEVEKLNIDNCNFTSCNTYQSMKGKANGAIAYVYGVKEFSLSNSKFKNSKNYSWKYGQHWDEMGELFEFANTEEINAVECTIDECVRLGIETE